MGLDERLKQLKEAEEAALQRAKEARKKAAKLLSAEKQKQKKENDRSRFILGLIAEQCLLKKNESAAAQKVGSPLLMQMDELLKLISPRDREWFIQSEFWKTHFAERPAVVPVQPAATARPVQPQPPAQPQVAQRPPLRPANPQPQGGVMDTVKKFFGD